MNRKSTFSLTGQGQCVEVAARTFLKGCIMTGRVNWARISSRNRMQRQGVEDIKGKTPLGGQPPKIRRKVSKAELREQAAAAFLAWREGQTAKDKR